MWSELIKRWLDMMTWWMPNRGSGETGGQGQSGSGSAGQSAGSQQKPAADNPAASAQKQSAQQQGGPKASEPARKQTSGSNAGKSASQSKSAGSKQSSGAKASGGASGAADLTEIKGIGPSVRDRLNGLGIRDFQQLASADADQVTNQLKEQMVVSKKRVQQWIDEARSRSG